MLILVLMMLSFLSLLGGLLLTSTTLDVSIGSNYKTELELRYLAEAGIEEGRERLRVGGGPETTPFVTAEGLSVFLEQDRNAYWVLRSVAQLGTMRRTIEATVMRSSFPDLPEPVSFQTTSGIDPRLQTGQGVEAILRDIEASATDVYSTAVLGNVGSSADYRIVVVGGDCDFGPGTGYGILIVRGKLQLRGNLQWNGLVLVVGQGEIAATPDANGRIAGGVFVARTVDGNPPVAELETGNVTVELDRSETDPSRYRFPYRPIAIREY